MRRPSTRGGMRLLLIKYRMQIRSRPLVIQNKIKVLRNKRQPDLARPLLHTRVCSVRSSPRECQHLSLLIAMCHCPFDIRQSAGVWTRETAVGGERETGICTLQTHTVQRLCPGTYSILENTTVCVTAPLLRRQLSTRRNFIYVLFFYTSHVCRSLYKEPSVIGFDDRTDQFASSHSYISQENWYLNKVDIRI